MQPWHYLLLLLVGLVTGVNNILSGGGSLLTLPVMIFLGMSPATANGTNRVALLVQSATAVTSFKKRGLWEPGRSLTLALCTIPGVLLGSVAAIKIDPVWFERLLALVMLGTVIVILKGRGGMRERRGESTHPVWAHLAMAGAGFYAGFIQAGVGFILMAILYGLLDLSLVRVNVYKVFIVGIYMIPSLLVFAFTGHVWWLAGIALAVGNGTGGWIGARVAVKGGDKVIRVVFTIAVIAMAVKLLIR